MRLLFERAGSKPELKAAEHSRPPSAVHIRSYAYEGLMLRRTGTPNLCGASWALGESDRLWSAAVLSYHYPHLIADRISFTFWARSKSRRDGLFIDRQPPSPRCLFVFQRRGSVASVVSGRLLRAAEKQKETSWGRLGYKQAIPTDFKTTIGKHRICNARLSA